MGDRQQERERCPQCGVWSHEEECPSCGTRTAGPRTRLVAVPWLEGAPAPPREIQLVREIKGPTVRDLLQASDHVLQQLPGQIRAMAQAVDDGDLAEADQRIDRAVGALLAGPGFRRRGRFPWMIAAWLVFLGLAVAFLLWL